MKKDIVHQCGDRLIDHIYLYAINFNFIIHLYVEIVFHSKDKIQHLFTLLINQILKTSQEPSGQNLDRSHAFLYG